MNRNDVSKMIGMCRPMHIAFNTEEGKGEWVTAMKPPPNLIPWLITNHRDWMVTVALCCESFDGEYVEQHSFVKNNTPILSLDHAYTGVIKNMLETINPTHVVDAITRIEPYSPRIQRMRDAGKKPDMHELWVNRRRDKTKGWETYKGY